eukprot:COSAG01_NODE_70378_length_258_cov_3.452830_1_plen_45_part_01
MAARAPPPRIQLCCAPQPRVRAVLLHGGRAPWVGGGAVVDAEEIP